MQFSAFWIAKSHLKHQSLSKALLYHCLVLLQEAILDSFVQTSICMTLHVILSITSTFLKDIEQWYSKINIAMKSHQTQISI